MKKQIFLSHTWQKDKLCRDNHLRVYELAEKLYKIGWSCWVDEDNIFGNIDAAMAKGIDDADVILICLTEEYFKKVNETANDPRRRDNCLKEWTYANARNKLIIPVIMEPDLLNLSDWPPGIVTLYFGSTLYINASKNDFVDTIININKILLKYNLRPNNIKNTNTNNIKNTNTNNIKNTNTNNIKNTNTNNIKNTVKNLLYITRLLPKTTDNTTRNSFPILSSERPKLLHNRWRSTGQLKEINI